MLFKTSHKYLNTVLVDSVNEVKFEYNNIDYYIVNISTTCGCSIPSDNKTEGIVTVKYHAGAIPKHLTVKNINWYTVVKDLFVSYHKVGEPKDIKQDKISITVTVKQR